MNSIFPCIICMFFQEDVMLCFEYLYLFILSWQDSRWICVIIVMDMQFYERSLIFVRLVIYYVNLHVGKNAQDMDAARLVLHYSILQANEWGHPTGQDLEEAGSAQLRCVASSVTPNLVKVADDEVN